MYNEDVGEWAVKPRIKTVHDSLEFDYRQINCRDVTMPV